MRIEIEIPDDKYKALTALAGEGHSLEDRLTKALDSLGNMALKNKEQLKTILGVFRVWDR